MASMSKVLRVAAVALAVTAVAGGCGGGGEKSAAPARAGGPSATRTTSTPASTAPVTGSGSGDFCSKISDVEATAVLGVPIARREQPSAAPNGVGGCIKGTPRQALSNLSKGAYVSFSTFPAGGELGSFDKVKASFPDAKVLAGLGDQALFSPTGGLVMGFLDGKVFSVQVVKAGKPGNEADAVTMARAFVARLG
jgi:hypothetical protein